jgi:small subunit ribosomal protein S16
LAVHIRLRRMGAKKRPFYRIVAADSRRSRDGRFLEILGTYNPIEKPAVVSVKEERVTAWLNNGAVPSDTVASLLTQIGFTDKYLKAKAGQDVTEIALRPAITERKKKTRKMKKAVVAPEVTATTAAPEVKPE